MDWQIGDKALCVKEFKTPRLHQETYPELYQNLTVRTISIGEGCEVFLRFEEIINPVLLYTEGATEAQFICTHFIKKLSETELAQLQEENINKVIA